MWIAGHKKVLRRKGKFYPKRKGIEVEYCLFIFEKFFRNFIPLVPHALLKLLKPLKTQHMVRGKVGNKWGKSEGIIRFCMLVSAGLTHRQF